MSKSEDLFLAKIHDGTSVLIRHDAVKAVTFNDHANGKTDTDNVLIWIGGAGHSLCVQTDSLPEYIFDMLYPPDEDE